MVTKQRWLAGLVTAAVALILVVSGCGGESKSEDCTAKCEGKCGSVGACQCGPCDTCEGDLCGGDGQCVPQCVNRVCGDDGCGGSCGSCDGDLECSPEGLCLEPCLPVCEGRECGDDNCGGSCGSCDDSLVCSDEGICKEPCAPQCDGKECGEDGCGGVCGQCTLELPYCQKGMCKKNCEPVCDGKECGDDECGGSCGTCQEGYVCGSEGTCVCGGCGDKVCGPDGCGGDCGSCPANNELCVDGACVCQPNCLEKECGPDGCGGECGTCKLNHVCTGDGSCVCIPDCAGKGCGPNGCGGLCGQCGCGEECLLYQCEFTACEEKECGLDGCGGSCGSCGQGQACVLGSCPGEGKACDDLNEVEWDGCHGGSLQEFLVNDRVTGAQQTPDVAALADGSFVVVWEDVGGDLAASAIKGKRFPADGSAPEDEFLVNSYQASTQKAPAVVGLPGGGFVVVWQSEGQDGGFNGIYGQRFKASGAKQGAEFAINTFTMYDQRFPALAVLTDGGFVVAWEGQGQDGMGFGVFGQRFDADGAKVGGEFQINTETISDQQMVSVAGLSGGGFVTLWGTYSAGGIAWDLFGQRWSAAGAKVGAEFAANAPWSQDGTTLNYQVYPRLAPLAGDGFVAVWQSTLQDGAEDGVYGQRFSATAKVGTEQLIHEQAAGNQQYPDIAPTPDGGYVVVWQSTGKDAAGMAVMMRRFSGQGVAAGGEVPLNVFGAGDQARPRVDVFADGSVVVVWQSMGQDGDDQGVYARRATADGAWLYR